VSVRNRSVIRVPVQYESRGEDVGAYCARISRNSNAASC
jgi:hypothetical protein